MTHDVTEMTALEMEQVSGGVTMSPDGKSCTEPREPEKRPTSGMNQGGPLAVVIAVLS